SVLRSWSPSSRTPSRAVLPPGSWCTSAPWGCARPRRDSSSDTPAWGSPLSRGLPVAGLGLAGHQLAALPLAQRLRLTARERLRLTALHRHERGGRLRPPEVLDHAVRLRVVQLEAALREKLVLERVVTGRLAVLQVHQIVDVAILHVRKIDDEQHRPPVRVEVEEGMHSDIAIPQRGHEVDEADAVPRITRPHGN